MQTEYATALAKIFYDLKLEAGEPQGEALDQKNLVDRQLRDKFPDIGIPTFRHLMAESIAITSKMLKGKEPGFFVAYIDLHLKSLHTYDPNRVPGGAKRSSPAVKGALPPIEMVDEVNKMADAYEKKSRDLPFPSYELAQEVAYIGEARGLMSQVEKAEEDRVAW